MSDLKSRFYRTFVDLPLGVRDSVIVVVGGQPMTWNVLKIEVDIDSDVAKEALKKMSDLRLLKK